MEAGVGRTEAIGRRVSKARRQSRLDPLWSSLPAVALVGFFVLVPLAIFAVYSILTSRLFEVSGPVTTRNFSDALRSNLNRSLTRNSIEIGLLAAVFSVGLALPMAYWMRHGAKRARAIVMFAVIASFMTGYLVRIYAFRTVLGTSGVINTVLLRLGIVDHPVEALLFSRISVTVALVHIFLPFATITLFAAMAPLSTSYLEAAEDLGANARQRWSRLIAPIMFAPALSTFVLVFVLSASDYVTPQFLGGTNGATIGTQVQVAFTGAGDFGAGAAVSMLMLVAFMICYAVGVGVPRLLGLGRLRFMS